MLKCDRCGYSGDSVGLSFNVRDLFERKYCGRCLIDFLDEHVGILTEAADKEIEDESHKRTAR